ncbi:oligopeptide transport system ATP-binding protein [Sporomusaceae bacterium BoRhaA]|uniref:ABC transporter ATP-binding protein n=1 Tax=Pelorhabdus rhamnosifermentans TaxID=2772457 RepID=UPI001C05ED84|nr:ABC transporter ATP-binding protein [Pelorhabdus rhamnosifermentans]MBU2699004.1 oligopeptide transport system ATP-binding protein [Pelorhabdus rhamnosifermentans]
MKPILEVQDLAVTFNTYAGEVRAVQQVSFAVHPGEAIGIVGESGCGKSVTAHSIMGLIPHPPGQVVGGKILFNSTDLLELSEQAMIKIRGNEIGMIFQDPMTSLNPVLTVGKQITESLKLHKRMTSGQAMAKAVDLLQVVGIPAAEKRLKDYPHHFSGGMRQRVMIAMALACNPKLLIADEPTTALDVTIQAQILDLIKDLKQQFNTAVIMISHDLGVIASLCNRVIVMYAGKVAEAGSVYDVFHNPQHPYTWGLLKSLPRLDADQKASLSVIDGQPPDLLQPPNGCPFHPRCPHAMKVCTECYPDTTQLNDEHSVKCWLQHPAAPKSEREMVR